MHRATDAGSYSKQPCLSITSVHDGGRSASRRCGFFCCDFWRSRRPHIWGPLSHPYDGLRRSTAMPAVLSLARITSLKTAEVDHQGGHSARADADDEDVSIDTHVLVTGG